MPESCYVSDSKDQDRKASKMEKVLITIREVLINFMILLPEPQQILSSQEATVYFLKIIEAKATGNSEENGDEEEE